MTHVIAYSEFRFANNINDPIRYKTDVFEISSGTSISEIYDYFKSNPSIKIRHLDTISHTWGDENVEGVIPYTQTVDSWSYTKIPSKPIVLRWQVLECDEKGNNTTPIFDLTTPLSNISHFDG
jgi:hypothetical protein